MSQILSAADRQTIADFHNLYYGVEGQAGPRTYCISWLGFQMFKCPLDLWVYQEIIAEQKPDLIIETGTFRGGSAHFLATLCDLVGQGRVITIDIDPTCAPVRPAHPRIEYLLGSSIDPAVVAHVKDAVSTHPNVLVILDADHRRDHVIEELRIYSRMIPLSGYLIVEDTNINGHPTYQEFGPGPWEAVHEFLAESPNFQIDRSRERFLMTMNPDGYLKRIA
jgi:cephalosporin hydroxylase